jgi:hypothetical protein
LRPVLTCHCVECRRWTGGPWPATAAARTDFVVVAGESLRWIETPASDTHARRGFCGTCGSSLFWDAPAANTVSIAAGSLDEPAGVSPAGHVYVSHVPCWYALPDDGLPRRERL